MEIKHAFAIVAFDGKHFGKDSLETKIAPLAGWNLGLQEFLIRVGLQLDEIRRSNDLFDFSEVNSFSGSRWHLDLFSWTGEIRFLKLLLNDRRQAPRVQAQACHKPYHTTWSNWVFCF